MREETRRFEVTTDNGRRFTIVERQNVVDNSTIDDPGTTRPGSKELFTSDGECVNVKSDGTYEIVGLSLTLRRLP